ncbi:DUF4440 domain-containing protein [Cryobacterium shii]|uniref:DUF4440 domain-containing protein n=1 Tax=Cryobacterium shii TaxID=1259235 RepID=A0AAQ2HFS0_9MICO|nr:DUF4440 domain-containing protein [Cryobacterium shii]TFC47398.1 DUF4440 domain-containing protein [Cryobacterium shii]
MTSITDDLPARLLHEEHEGWQAILAGRGGAYYRSTMTSDGLLILPGRVVTRDEAPAFFQALSPVTSYKLRDPAVVRLNDHAGVLVYRLIAHRGDEVTEANASTTYVFKDGGWCVAAHQQTAI